MLTYHYYSTGKVESIQSSNSNGANVSYTYDDLNRLSTVVDNHLPGNNTTNYTYDNASNVATVAYPNGVTSTSTYDEAGGPGTGVKSHSPQKSGCPRRPGPPTTGLRRWGGDASLLGSWDNMNAR